jgi:hypothetical protein
MTPLPPSPRYTDEDLAMRNLSRSIVMIKNNTRLRLEKRAAVACEQLLSRCPRDLYVYRTLQELNANKAQSRPDYELRHLIDEINELHGLDLFVQSSVTTATINPTTYTESAIVPLQQSQLKPPRRLTLEREYLLHLTNVESAFSRTRVLAAYSDYILKPVARFLKFVNFHDVQRRPQAEVASSSRKALRQVNMYHLLVRSPQGIQSNLTPYWRRGSW